MKNEVIGMCPSCISKKGKERMVDIYVARNDKGDITAMYIFGDDDFDVPSSSATVRNVKFSDDNKSVTEVECPRCNENILVDIPIIKQQSEFFRALTKNTEPLIMASSQASRQL